jgi:hypothetical protein
MSVFEDVRADRRLTCEACPTQYEGRLPDGRIYYFRYRSGHAWLGLGETIDDAVEDSFAGPVLVLGDRLSGSMEEDEFEAAAAELMRLRQQ